MTPEQKQRIERIRERRAAGDESAYSYDDIDFLLSLVKSQEADDLTPFCAVHAAIEQNGGLTLEIGNDCVACSLNERSAILNLIEPFAADDKTEDSLTVLQKIINGEPMRSTCVEKVAETHDSVESACNAALMDVYDLSIANAPMPAKDCREIADCIGDRVGQIRKAIAALTEELESLSIEQPKE